MHYGLYLAAEGAHAQTKRLEVVANNLANANSNGFKRDLAIFQARSSEAIARGQAAPGSGSLNDLGGGVSVVSTLTDFSPGPVDTTNRPTDLAIDGDAFFVVSNGGKSLLTRSGNFKIDGSGRLVDVNGHSVLSDGGTPVVIDPENGPFQFTPDGGVTQAGDITYLAMVRPRSNGDLVKQGENTFMPLSPPVPILPEERQVAVGHLEMSGVKPTIEMTELIESTRAFEANISMIKGYDQLMTTLVQGVLKES